MRTDTYKVKPNSGFVVAPLFGCNLVSWVVDGRPVFYVPEGFSRQPEHFFHAGNPVLFPSVGRTWDISSGTPVPEQYRIFGDPKTYTMPTHGLLPAGHFQKRRERIAGERIEVEYLFTLRQAIQEEHYPFDVSLMLRYVLRARSIKLEAVLENKGPTPAPFSFGYHPYFYFEDRQGVEVHLPCRDRVTLNPQLLIPEGNEALASNVITMDATTTYDNVFGTMTGRQALVVDKKTGRIIRIDVDEAIENLVIYSPAGSKFVCIEPWTKGLGAFSSLNQDGWQKGERINVLQPGQSRTITVSYTIEG